MVLSLHCKGVLLVLFVAMTLLSTTPTNAENDHGTSTRITTILSYSVSVTISSRFARTRLQLEIANERDDCKALAGFTFQLPINARVTEMTMTTTPGNCEKTGVVKEISRAEQEFQQQVVQGKPAALLKAYDATQYGVQISLPPTGQAVIDIQLEELLHRYRGKIEFQVPLYPGFAVPIQAMTLVIAIQEPTSGVARFHIEKIYDRVDSTLLNQHMRVVPADSNTPVATAKLEVFNILPTPAGEDDPLPNMLRGYYDPGPIVPSGLLLSDPFNKCYVYLFNPDSLLASMGSLPRNIVFVIDVSGSMSGQKLMDAKLAFSAMISRLTEDDYFCVQTFSSDAMEQRFGPYLATEDVKIMGKDWVHNLNAGGSTNLEGAYIEGIDQVERMHLESIQSTRGNAMIFVPVVVILTDGQPTVGETDPWQIARNIRNANTFGEVHSSIFGLGFGDGADFGLLSAISLQNNGKAVRIYEGYGDATIQMESFYEGELGAVLMSDVQVVLNGTFDSQTQTHMPIFADGSEFMVRARVLADVSGPAVLGATTTANTVDGYSTWSTGVSATDQLEILPNNRNECIQSFAHQKITELMLFRDAARTLGWEVHELYSQFALRNGNSEGNLNLEEEFDLVKTVEAEALQLALEAAVVWPELTAMVTEDSSSCSHQSAIDVPVCYDGNGIGEEEDVEDGTAEDEGRGGSVPGPAPVASPGVSRGTLGPTMGVFTQEFGEGFDYDNDGIEVNGGGVSMMGQTEESASNTVDSGMSGGMSYGLSTCSMRMAVAMTMTMGFVGFYLVFWQ